MKLNVNAVCLGDSGYANHSRQLILAMDKAGIDIALEHPPIPQGTSIEPRLLELMKKTQDRNAPNLVINLPYYWSQKSAHNNTVGFLVFEGLPVHLSWKVCADKPHVKQIWVPSTHVKEACQGIGKEIKIIPHGVDTDLFNPDTQPLEKLKSDAFTFLFNGGWSQGQNDRKGLDIALKAFNEEFGEHENVRFIAKVNKVYNPPGYSIEQQVQKLNLKQTNPVKIILLGDNIPYEKLPALYKTADVFVMPTKAEAFGLTMIESMSCGVPCIATGYGGQTDFVNSENGWLIDYDLKPATDQNIFYENSMWGIPKQEHLQKLMREAFANRDLVRQKGLAARKTAERFTWNDSAKLAREALETLKY